MDVTIRPLQLEDAYISVAWRNDPEVFKYTGNTYKEPISLQSEIEWISRVINNDDEYRCAIIADGKYVGNIYLTDISEQSAIYHIFIGEKDFWGKGVAKRASLLLLQYAFSKLRLSTVRLKVRIANIPARHLYKSLGFKDVDNDGEWITMEVYSPCSVTV